MDLQAVEGGTFMAFRTLFAAVVMVVCVLRAAMMDARARALIQAIFVSLAMSSAGLLLAFLMQPWLRHIFVVWFMGSVCALLLDGQRDWMHGHLPESILKLSERWPFKERRSGEDRRQPPGDQDKAGD